MCAERRDRCLVVVITDKLANCTSYSKQSASPASCIIWVAYLQDSVFLDGFPLLAGLGDILDMVADSGDDGGPDFDSGIC